MNNFQAETAAERKNSGNKQNLERRNKTKHVPFLNLTGKIERKEVQEKSRKNETRSLNANIAVEYCITVKVSTNSLQNNKKSFQKYFSAACSLKVP